MSKLTGIVLIEVEGETLESLPGVTQTPVLTETGKRHYTETYAESVIECQVAHVAETDMTSFIAIRDKTIMFKCDTGQTYVMNDGCLSETPKLSDGKVSLKFGGSPAKFQ
jgi:hypothetical protein